VACLGAAGPASERPPEFARDIRPIFSDACFKCHGPDTAKRKADLRLDTEEGAFKDLGGYHALVPGKLDESELYRRITSEDDDERMPPPSTGRRLSPEEIDRIKRWIEQGAKWQKHWSLIPPKRPPLPQPKNAGWVRNPIDAFVLDRLEREGLAPAAEADRATLIRRISLDLTGLPPEPPDVDVFLGDTLPNALDKVVDRLLASPHFGERLASRWLDGARYADTHGYQSDGERTMWRWRDWVIDAFNRNMPFDRFTVEQLAGDLLPNPTLDQNIATGFNRNHRGNGEGGIVPEEYLVEYSVDRVETTATVWLGLTLGCTRCHDHKYDPFTQQEFYQLFAYFNNIPERGRTIKYGNSPPMIPTPTDDQVDQLAAMDRRIEAVRREIQDREPELAAAQDAWEKSADARSAQQWIPSAGLLAHYPLDGATADQLGHAPTGKFQGGATAYTPGLNGKAAAFDGESAIEVGDVGDFGFYDKFSCGAWIHPTSNDPGTILSRMTDEANYKGYELSLEDGKVQANFSVRWLDDALRVETEDPLVPGRWHHVMMTYDSSRIAAGVQIYVDGRPQKLHVTLDGLNQDFRNKEPFRIGSRDAERRFRGAIAEVCVYKGVLAPETVAVLATADAVNEILALPPTQRAPQQACKLRAYFLETQAPAPIRRAYETLAKLLNERVTLVESFPTTMIMSEMEPPRETFILTRGEYDKPGKKVQRGVPASLPLLPPGAPNNRLGFARWLVDPGHPLTARVTVNRFWQLFFGNGLVRTLEDFGSQGEWPTHPELLDWLATEFVRTGWDVKALCRLIVTSATYQQSSRTFPATLAKDPDNQLLAHGPRWRLPAESIRDQALAASGLLVHTLGGASVHPYQPAGLGKDLNGKEEPQDHGEALYRRSLYTYWKRTVAPPSMVTFDAAGRETCIVRETRTNTPLQALTLLNDVTFVEAARVLAQRILANPDLKTPEERLTRAFRLLLTRPPSPAELKVLRADLEAHREQYRASPKDAAALVAVGEFPRDPRLDPRELAAYTATASLILNLDETISKD
jgi:hypothetical protein